MLMLMWEKYNGGDEAGRFAAAKVSLAGILGEERREGLKSGLHSHSDTRPDHQPQRINRMSES